MNKPTPFALVAAFAAVAATLAAPSAHALFKVVHPDGRVSYSDRPPESEAGKAAPRVTPVTNSVHAGASDGALPHEVREAARRFPVTLYTADGCDPCAQGRELLMRRGIPFNERRATSAEDRAAWKGTTGSTEAPVLAVGAERIAGFNSSSWTSSLDAAGYPSTSKLPTTYKQAEVSNIAPPKAAPKAAPKPAPAPVAAPPAPGGIRF